MSDSSESKPKILEIIKGAINPYAEMFKWLNSFTIGFIKNDASSSIATSLPVESILAVIDNLAPEKVNRTISEKAGPFYFPGDKTGVILVHGFSATAQEMKYLGEQLNDDMRYTTFCVLLAGHGTSPADLAQTDMIDWYKSLKEAYDFMKERCERIFLVGHSMGGTLSLIFAANEDIDGIVSLCTPIRVEYFMQDYLFLVADLLQYFPRRKEEIELMDEHGLINYRESSLKGVENLLDLMEVAREEIPKVTAPIFTVTAGNDKRVPLYNAEKIRELVKSKIKEDFFVEDAQHTILFDKKRDIVIQRIKRFLETLSDPTL